MPPVRDFFVSYTQADHEWAAWVSWLLDEAGFTTFVQAWDIPPGSNFVLEMHQAATTCERTVAILSPDYFASLFTAPEWTAAFAQDPTGSGRKLVPVRVRPCQPPGLLKSLVYIDLVGLEAEAAKKKLLSSIEDARLKPPVAPAFPAELISVPPPGASSDLVAARELLDVLGTTFTTVNAQSRLRDELVAKMTARLNITEQLEYEPFFERYYNDMNDHELRIHATIRAFTKDVMRDYNEQALQLAEANPGLEAHVSLLGKLKDHLRLWHAKYDRLFESSPDVCLVYVGVAEGVPFPSNRHHPESIEEQLEQFLKSSSS